MVKPNPRVKMHRDGKVTISGLDYQDARSIITGATLHFYDGEQKASKDELMRFGGWHRRLRQICSILDQEIKDRIHEDYLAHMPVLDSTQKTRERKTKVLRAKKERILIDEIIQEIKTPTS